MNAESKKRTFSLRKRVAQSDSSHAVLLLLNAFWFYKGAMDAANRAYDQFPTASLKEYCREHSLHGRGHHGR